MKDLADKHKEVRPEDAIIKLVVVKLYWFSPSHSVGWKVLITYSVIIRGSKKCRA